MNAKSFFWFLLAFAIFTLVGCQNKEPGNPTPQIVVVTATAEAQGPESAEAEETAVPSEAQAPLVPEAVEVEVTRVVEVPVAVEVTRVVTQAIEMVAEPLPQENGEMGELTDACVDKLWTYKPLTDATGNELLDNMYLFETESQENQLNDLWQLTTKSVMVLEGKIDLDEPSRYGVGLGSAWTWDEKQCPEGWDPVAEFINHGIGRLDQGFSGVLIDNRDPETALVVGNLFGLSKVEVENYWNLYVSAATQAGSIITDTLIVPTDTVDAIYPSSAEARLIQIYGSLEAIDIAAASLVEGDSTEGLEPPKITGGGQPIGGGSCGSANDDIPPFGPNATINNPENGGPLLIRPWWDPATSAPTECSDPATCQGQIQMVVMPGESVVLTANGGPIYQYPASCSKEQVVADGTHSAPSWPFYHIVNEQWVAGP